VRERILPVAESYGARIKVAEVPPGPPVLQTLVAEVYGPDQEGQVALARQIRDLFKSTDGIVDVDWYVEDEQPKFRMLVDKEKAALHGISEDDIARTMRWHRAATRPGCCTWTRPRRTCPSRCGSTARRAATWRASANCLKVEGRMGRPVALGELVRFEETVGEKSIYHKNMMPVTYVTADIAGAMESPVYAILKLGPEIDRLKIPRATRSQHTASQPFDSGRYAIKWDGEWHITYEVFRDLGLAFAAVLILIYGLVVGWFQSFVTPLVIMVAIPFSLMGILPAHGMMGAFFTATSMIGFIAGAGIVVRNSIILVDFIELRLKEGMPLEQAVVDAGAVRFRPMLLTAAAVVVGAAVILFDPIFQGLAIALMAGEVASLALSRMTVPIVYYMINHRKEKQLCASNAVSA
jgi:multidrug efflux pump subunit AcrB